MEKKLYLFSGCNGSGKSSAAFHILPELLLCNEFLNADSIAAALSPFKPERVAIKAGKIMLQRIDELIDLGSNFTVETTLSSNIHQRIIRKAKEKNYTVILLFLYLKSPEMAVKRVASRIEKGGHSIPKDVIFRRYDRGIENLFKIYINLCDKVIIFDNSCPTGKIIASNKDSDELKILDPKIYSKIQQQVKEPQESYSDPIIDQIIHAMNVHYRLLIEETLAANSYLIGCDDHGNIIRYEGEELRKFLDEFDS